MFARGMYRGQRGREHQTNSYCLISGEYANWSMTDFILLISVLMTQSGYKHSHISLTLAEEISAGKYPNGAQIQSEQQLARRFGVSRPTVRRALLELRERGLIECRAGSGTYVRRGRRQTERDGGLRQLGLIVPDLKHTEIFEPICGELAALSRAHGYGLLWGGDFADMRR